ncbi:MAG: M67 family metallopeptidase [Pyrobaculum sp.]
MSHSIKIPTAFLQEAREVCSPEAECPALLFGRGNTVYTWRWAKNLLGDRHAFEISPEEMYKHIKEGEEAGLELLAIFHTHPGDPKPSPLDLRHMRLWRIPWIIANIYTWEVAGWLLEGGLREVEIAFI